MATAVSLIFVFSTPLAALYAVLGFLKSPSRWRRYFPFFLLTVFMISHAFELNCELDITRYYYMAEDLARYDSLKDIFMYRGDGLFVRNLFFWAAARLGDLRLIPAVSNTIVYGAAAYITCDAAAREDKAHWIPRLLGIQLLTLQFFNITCNVRNICAFSLVALAAYQDLVRKRRSIGILLLYILPSFLHPSAFFLVLFRVLASALRKNIGVAAGVFLLFPVITQLLYEHRSLFSFGGTIGTILYLGVTKLYNYWNKDDALTEYESVVAGNVGDKIQRGTMLLFVILALVLICLYILRRKKTERSSFQVFVMELGLMTAASTSFFIAPHYWRFFSAFIVVFPAVLVQMQDDKEVLRRWRRVINLVMLGLAVILFIMHVRRFVLYVKLDVFFNQVLIENIVFLLVKALLNAVSVVL